MIKKNTYFVDLDGTLLKYRPFESYKSKKAEPLIENIEYLRNLKKEGHMVIITTARPHYLYSHTIGELVTNKIPFDNLIMGIERGPRYIINDMDPEVSENRAIAINIKRNGRIQSTSR